MSGNGKVNGTVKFFNPDKGYGFVRVDGAQDVFLHANELRRSGVTDLTPVTTGAKVIFEREMVDGKGPKAVNIALLPPDAPATSTLVTG